jgi:cyclase
MLRTRVIPVIQIKNRELVKTVQFQHPKYLGDPLNAIKIFNEKRVDELVIIDIQSSKNKSEIDFEFIETLCTECFMPISYGGGVKSIEDFKKLFSIGIEKVIVNSLLIENPKIVSDAIKIFGSQSIIASIDYKKNWITKKLNPYINSGTKKIKKDVLGYITEIIKLGVGELLITYIENEGTFKGYELEILSKINSNIPIIINGGASDLADLIEAKKNGADALAAGSLFCLQKPHLAVLITYINEEDISLLNKITK